MKTPKWSVVTAHKRLHAGTTTRGCLAAAKIPAVRCHRSVARFTLAILITIPVIRAFAFDPLLPDPQLTPGRVAGPQDRRGVTREMQDEMFARYRIPLEARRFYRVDHLIPRELGGADAVENLWPQKRDARPYSPERKDLLTKRILSLIANGRMTLPQAQQELAEDWISAYVMHIGMIYLAPRPNDSR